MAAVDLQERMMHLRIDLDQLQLQSKEDADNATLRVSVAANLVRLLIEPREEMARSETKLAAKRVMRRDLGVSSLTGVDEHKVYGELRRALDEAKSIIWRKRKDRWEERQNCRDATLQLDAFSSIPPIFQRLAWLHYRLGSFFRTLTPREIHRSKSTLHFRAVLEMLDPPHMVESFSLEEHSPQLHGMYIKSQFWLGTLADADTTKGSAGQVERCPPQYVTSLYSTFAATFDDQLVNKLHYQTPTKLRRLVDDVLRASETKRFRRGADLGCGTGLSGAAFSNLVDDFSGVDLSIEMIEQAEKRGCYTSLDVGDIESILQDASCVYDLIISCDCFCYLGDLSSVFQSVAESLTPKSGLFAFSTEVLPGQENESNGGFILQACARFAHNQSYLRRLATENGLSIRAMKEDVIRQNAGEDVRGILAVLSLE